MKLAGGVEKMNDVDRARYHFLEALEREDGGYKLEESLCVLDCFIHHKQSQSLT